MTPIFNISIFQYFNFSILNLPRASPAFVRVKRIAQVGIVAHISVR